jgi:ABC-type multidrug transport system ATPase subunit
MLQRLALCRTLLHEPELYFLDEPFAALDREGTELLERELAERRNAATFLVATHDPARLERLASALLAFA